MYKINNNWGTKYITNEASSSRNNLDALVGKYLRENNHILYQSINISINYKEVGLENLNISEFLIKSLQTINKRARILNESSDFILIDTSYSYEFRHDFTTLIDEINAEISGDLEEKYKKTVIAKTLKENSNDDPNLYILFVIRDVPKNISDIDSFRNKELEDILKQIA